MDFAMYGHEGPVTLCRLTIFVPSVSEGYTLNLVTMVSKAFDEMFKTVIL